MNMLRIGLIGYGTVGSGVVERLAETKAEIEQIVEDQCEIAAVLVKDRQKKRAVNINAIVDNELGRVL